MIAPPAGMTLFQLAPDTPSATRGEVRAYCLGAIKDAYGYDYRQDWHWDLDSLLNPEQSPYISGGNGAFYALRAEDQSIIGTAGMRSLSTSASVLGHHGARYPKPDEVAYLCRVYVNRRYRKRGLGDFLVGVCREAAQCSGYRAMYFHCERHAQRLRAYWESQGFACFAEDDMSAHYDGRIAAQDGGAISPIAA